MLRVVPLPGFLAGWEVSPFLSELVVSSRDDVLALLPAYMREGDVPLRDAWADATMLTFIRYTSDMAADAARTNPAYGEGQDLDLIGKDVLPRAYGEGDEAYRKRLCAGAQGATPRAMLAAVDAILEPFGKAGVAYYVELPDDEIFVFENEVVLSTSGSLDGSNLQGGYMENLSPTGTGIGAGCIVADERHYEARTRCTPRHQFIFGVYRDPETTRARGAETTEDFTDAFNQWGHTLVHIPPFDAPEHDDPAGAYVASIPRSPNSVLPALLITTSGALTEEAVSLDERTFDLQTDADLQAAESAGTPLGAAVFSRDLDGALAVDAIRTTLRARASYPDQFTIVLDPELA
jgi:hypothetical protein